MREEGGGRGWKEYEGDVGEEGRELKDSLLILEVLTSVP